MDVFLFGAGFSKFVNSNMPLMTDLGRLIKEKYKDLPNVPYEFSEELNAEKLLSYFSEELPWEPEELILKKKAAFIELSKFIGQIIIEKQNESKPQFPDFLEPLFTTIVRRNATLLTLNYDTILESAVDYGFNKTPPYGAPNWWLYYQLPLTLDIDRNSTKTDPFPSYLSFSQLKMLKLHGSVNWLYSGRSSFYGETIYLENTDKGMFRQSGKHLTQDKVPLIIPPTFSKSSFFNNETIKLLWRLAKEEVEKCSRLVFFGYSFPESDSVIKTLLTQNLKKNVEIIIVDIDEKVKDRIQHIFKNHKILFFNSSNHSENSFFQWYANSEIMSI